MEWELRRFRCSRDQEAECNKGKWDDRNCRSIFQKVRNLEAVEIRKGDQRTGQQSHATDLCDDKRLDAACYCLRVIVVERDQAIRTKSRNFPKEKRKQQITAQHKTCHRADEEQHEEVVTSKLRVVAHVIDREDDSQGTDDRGDRGQRCGESIGDESQFAKGDSQGNSDHGFGACKYQKYKRADCCQHTENNGKCMLEFCTFISCKPD